MGGTPKTMVGRILMFTWSFGPLILGPYFENGALRLLLIGIRDEDLLHAGSPLGGTGSEDCLLVPSTESGN